jgi:hypothetical protein
LNLLSLSIDEKISFDNNKFINKKINVDIFIQAIVVLNSITSLNLIFLERVEINISLYIYKLNKDRILANQMESSVFFLLCFNILEREKRMQRKLI